MSLMEQSRPSGRSRRRFTMEFKADAVALVLDGDRPVAHVARDLGIGGTNLGNWVRQARIDRGEKPGLTTEERSELVRLRGENSKLRMERELPCERRRFGCRSRDSDPVSVGRFPEGRGVPDKSRVRCWRGEPPGVLRLVSPAGEGAQSRGSGRSRAGRRDQTGPRGLGRGLRVAEGDRGAAPAWPQSQPQARLPAHAGQRHLRHL